ncbi:phosphatidate cytidylyltransferase [Geminisphaera colitermitum]|uniref:phosphatidate cytidylyltransferase n=1 Tax=Geminisphaera colitermitum TaxID=1148786 RepID=UPI0005BD1492|nr:phosphatidate cytidylyltransferase [Geminisphaera colitermitum]
MLKRTLSTLSLWAIVIGVLWFFGAPGAVALAVLVGALTQLELCLLVRKMGHRPFVRTSLLFGILIMFAPAAEIVANALFANSSWQMESGSFFLLHACRFAGNPANLLALAAIVCVLLLLARRDMENRVESLAWTLFVLLCVPFLLHYLVRIICINVPHPRTGVVLALWLIATAKFCDVGALLTGLACGKHKMAPLTSPKKTWEGAVGGVLTSVLVSVVIVAYCSAWLPDSLTPAIAAAIAVPIAILGIVSDLLESVIKRRAGAKDSGNIIPGIGGIFDLTDSLLLAAPAAWFLLASPIGLLLFALFQ